ncbi:MAG: GNAT family N-acetyltransferase [Bacteroidales bacterium]
MNESGIKCIDSNANDLDLIVHIQMSAFPESLSTLLGKRFTKKMLSWYIESDRGVMFHIYDQGSVLGFIGGIMTRHPGMPGAATCITQHSFNAFVQAFLLRPWLIFHTENLKRFSFIVKNICLKLGWKGSNRISFASDPAKSFVPFMGLVVIGVLPEQQGKGFGSILLREFEKRALREGFHRINLSVKKSNHQAIDAYKKNDWRINIEGPEVYSMYKILE